MLQDFRLRVFQTVVGKGSFTSAAKVLNISQPAVSQNIAELETVVGDTLVERNSKGIKLTTKGEVLLEYATRILHLYDCLERELVPKAGEPEILLRIVSCPIAANYILPSIIDRFGRLFPFVQITLFERDNYEMVDMINDASADLCVVENYEGRLADCIRIEPFASLNVGFDSMPIKQLSFLYPSNSEVLGSIESFILTAKTIR